LCLGGKNDSENPLVCRRLRASLLECASKLSMVKIANGLTTSGEKDQTTGTFGEQEGIEDDSEKEKMGVVTKEGIVGVFMFVEGETVAVAAKGKKLGVAICCSAQNNRQAIFGSMSGCSSYFLASKCISAFRAHLKPKCQSRPYLEHVLVICWRR